MKMIVIQLLSFLAWSFMFLSYYRKNTNKILLFQIMGNITFCVHYLLLGAYSGLCICLLDAICNFGYYKTDKDNFIYYVSIPFRILGGVLTRKTLIDTLPVCASLVEGYSLTKTKKIVVIGGILTYSIWTIYDFNFMSYVGMIFDLIIVLSNIGILLCEHILKKNIVE